MIKKTALVLVLGIVFALPVFAQIQQIPSQTGPGQNQTNQPDQQIPKNQEQQPEQNPARPETVAGTSFWFWLVIAILAIIIIAALVASAQKGST